MMSLLRLTIFLSVIPLLVLAGKTVAADESLERLLPQDVAILVKCNRLGEHLDMFQNSQLFKILSALQHEEKPGEPSIESKLEQVYKQPFFHLVKTEVVMGFVPPKRPDTPPTVIIMGKGSEKLAQHLDALLQKEEKKQKLYKLGSEDYKGIQIRTYLHSEKNQLEKKYLLVTPDKFILSNEIERVKACFDRLQNGQNCFVVPKRYRNLPENSMIKFYIDVQKFDIDLSKRAPVEKRYYQMREIGERVRAAVKNTKSISGCLFFDNGVIARIVRERKTGSAPMLPAISFPQKIIENRTIAFFIAPLPYQVFWFAAKQKALRKNPRKWRKLEAGIENLFDWQSFQEDILPKIGPATAILVNLPGTSDQPVALPHISLLIKTHPSLDFKKPLKALWEWGMKNPDFADHFQPAPREVEGGVIVRCNLKNTPPVDELLDLAHALVPGGFLVSTHATELERMIPLLRTSENSRQVYLYGYVSFSAFADLLKVNASFLQKQAAKKGEKLSQKKLELLYGLLNTFEHGSIELRDRGNLEVLELAIKVNNP